MKVGYIRVSSISQNTERQLDGIELEKTFIDHASGKSMERPKLQECLTFLREGDVLIVHSMDRLARNLIDLRQIVEKLTNKGVSVEFIKENLIFNDNKDNAMNQFLLSVMGAFAEFERALIKERQKEGIAIAKERGVYTGRKRKLSNKQVAQIQQQKASGVSISNIDKQYNLNRSTIYRNLKIQTETKLDV